MEMFIVSSGAVQVHTHVVWCGVLDTYGGESYCKLSTASVPGKMGDHQLRNLPTFLNTPHTKGLIRIVVASQTNPSKTPATLNNYLWCIKYNS